MLTKGKKKWDSTGVPLSTNALAAGLRQKESTIMAIWAEDTSREGEVPLMVKELLDEFFDVMP